MRQDRSNDRRTRQNKSKTRIKFRTGWLASLCLILLAVGCGLLAFAPRSYGTLMRRTASSGKPPARTVLNQPGPSASDAWRGRLALQPQADRLRRSLGQRFVAPGREVAALTGLLTIGADQHRLQLTRAQQSDGEQVAIGLDGGPASLTWSTNDGAVSAGSPAADPQRSLIERLTLDSPDQFILAQLRGAGYYTVARSVLPAEANGADDYTGPVWDLVRVGEPEGASKTSPQSRSRLYYINSATGLIDKVISNEPAGEIVAEITDWVSQDGEWVPAHIAWKQNDQIIMELTISSISYAPLQ
jgi:hypothetical protein